MAHARLGPSNHRWPNCPGSVREEAIYEDTSGAAAIDGTGSHLLLELCLINGVRADAYDMQVIGVDHEDMPMGWMVDKARCDRVQQCLDYVLRRYNELQSIYVGATVTIEAETKSNPGEAYGRTDWWGTCDITIIVTVNNEVVFVEVIDYKDGRGYVTEKYNSQLMSYLHGKTYDLTECVQGMMTIVQPRTKVAVRSQLIELVDLQGRMDKMAVAAALTDEPEAPLIADTKNGKGHCMWCKHGRAGNCDAQSNQKLKVVQNMETTGLVAKVQGQLITMQGFELAEILDAEKAFIDSFKQAKEEAVRRINTGHDVPGYAMLAGKTTRMWNEDEETMVKKFKAMKLKQADYYPQKLISPAAAEKLEQLSSAQLKNMDKLISSVAGKDSLKKSNKPTATDVFADVPVVETPAIEAPAEMSFL